jgi:phospholipid/cholesterol/gamma-HCH transport system substrate-binding protein
MARPRQSGGYDERFFRSTGRPGPTAVGIATVVLAVVGIYLAATKSLPWGGPDYEITAAFENSASIRSSSPVRIAGVNVGEVTSVTREGRIAKVTFSVEDEGRPIHVDAGAKIRPRIFLEGNFFIDLQPGSPSAPELEDGGTIPLTHTATAVQLDEILTALQSPARANLGLLAQGYGTALTHLPGLEEDLTQDLDVRGESAAQAINDAFGYGGPAGKGTAIVNEALLGTTPRDLSRLLEGSQRTFGALVSREQQLKDLITNLNVTAGALAAESGNLAESVRRLAPTLITSRRSLLHLSQALPPLRAFAREVRPGVAEIPATIDAAEPWLDQVNPLLTQRELGGIASLLARGVPELARAVDEGLAALPRIKLASRCVDEVLVPAGNVPLEDPFATGVENFKEFFYATVGIAGESANFDGNGQYLRFQPGGGGVLTRAANPAGVDSQSNEVFGHTVAPPLGTTPPLTPKPAYKPKAKCFRNPVPDLNGPAAEAGPPSPAAIG